MATHSSCLEDPMDRGAWRALVHTVEDSRTQLKRLHSHIADLHEEVIFTDSWVSANLKRSCRVFQPQGREDTYPTELNVVYEATAEGAGGFQGR